MPYIKKNHGSVIITGIYAHDIEPQRGCLHAERREPLSTAYIMLAAEIPDLGNANVFICVRQAGISVRSILFGIMGATRSLPRTPSRYDQMKESAEPRNVCPGAGRQSLLDK